jgi:hypothetical protein
VDSEAEVILADSAYFPSRYTTCDGFSNPPIRDPAILYVEESCSLEDDDNGVKHKVLAVSLVKTVEEHLEEVTGAGEIDAEATPQLAAMRDMFHMLAAKIDAALRLPHAPL